MSERTVAAGKFKAECLALLDDVARTGRPIVVTKRGKPVARVVGIDPPPSLRGSVRILVSEEAFLAPLDEPWDAQPERTQSA